MSLLLLFGLRVWLFLRYPQEFASLEPTEVLMAFWMGFRVDVATLFTALALPTLLLLAPFKGVLHRRYRQVMGLAWGLILCVITGVIVGDILYFGFVHRHLSNELLVIAQDLNLLLDMALEFYLMEMLLSTLLMAFAVAFFWWLFSTSLHHSGFGWRDFALFVLIALLLFLGIRQNLSGHPFGITHAFASPKIASGNLALNGFFSTLRAPRGKGVLDEKAIDVMHLQNLLDSNRTAFIDEHYPAVRRFNDARAPKPYNVVIILLESWSARYIDALSGGNLGITPNFDALAREGVLFTRAYANGQRSIEGIGSVLCGITQPSALPNVGWGLEMHHLSYLGRLAGRNGYETLAMQSSERGSFRLDAIMRLAGFAHYYGAEDMARSGREDGAHQPRFGTWDGNMFDLLHVKLRELKEPFLGFTFSASTHSPFHSPGRTWERYPHDPARLEGFYNTLYYADAMLGEFMRKAKQEPWFERTLFIITADHTLGYKEIGKDDDALEKHHIPLLLYAPSLLSPRMDARIASQNDIFPTIVDFLGWSNPFASLGQSLFDAPTFPHAFVRQGSSVGLIGEAGYLLIEGGQTRQSTLEADEATRYLKALKTLEATQSSLLLENRWAKE